MSASRPNVVILDPQRRPAREPATPGPLPSATDVQRTIAFAESWSDEPTQIIPADPQIAAALPAALAEAQRALEPGNPAEVLQALTLMAERRGLALPEGLALDLDVELLARWPRDLFRLAFRRVWENFGYRRMPEVPDFKRTIEAELQERRERLARLDTLQRKLEMDCLRNRWTEEQRARRYGMDSSETERRAACRDEC
jgi:hypothetical protein